MDQNEWLNLFSIPQSGINIAQWLLPENVASVTAFTGRALCCTIKAIIYMEKSSPVSTGMELCQRRAVEILKEVIKENYTGVQEALQTNQERIRNTMTWGSVLNLTKGAFVSVALRETLAGWKSVYKEVWTRENEEGSIRPCVSGWQFLKWWAGCSAQAATSILSWRSLGSRGYNEARHAIGGRDAVIATAGASRCRERNTRANLLGKPPIWRTYFGALGQS